MSLKACFEQLKEVFVVGDCAECHIEKGDRLGFEIDCPEPSDHSAEPPFRNKWGQLCIVFLVGDITVPELVTEVSPNELVRGGGMSRIKHHDHYTRR